MGCQNLKCVAGLGRRQAPLLVPVNQKADQYPLVADQGRLAAVLPLPTTAVIRVDEVPAESRLRRGLQVVTGLQDGRRQPLQYARVPRRVATIDGDKLLNDGRIANGTAASAPKPMSCARRAPHASAAAFSAVGQSPSSAAAVNKSATANACSLSRIMCARKCDPVCCSALIATFARNGMSLLTQPKRHPARTSSRYAPRTSSNPASGERGAAAGASSLADSRLKAANFATLPNWVMTARQSDDYADRYGGAATSPLPCGHAALVQILTISSFDRCRNR